MTLGLNGVEEARPHRQVVEERHLMTKFGDYRIKVDVIFDNYTWAPQQQAEYVIREWIKRQAEHDKVMAGAFQAGRVSL